MPVPFKSLTSEDRAQIVEMYKNGATLREVGIAFDISHTKARRVIVEAGIDTRSPDMEKTDRNQKIRDMADVGFRYQMIADKFQISRQRVHQIVQGENDDIF